MFDAIFVLAMQQRYGVCDLGVTTKASAVYTYLNEFGRAVHVAKPVLVFQFAGHKVEAVMPMRVVEDWVTGSAGVAMKRVIAECAWTADDVERCIARLVADLTDDLKVKGAL